ncbi:GtrA family protein [Neobacillus mesonae]|uniref:GtrA family protein n=1 Tax=Neobacillus mesonae TaxID=1193713 RepID=A0A3T0I380_9BACI|nr:GtrA family protein [Neobacillus mesonae]AZU63790.1 GtrA family protein [Neobacillus mesonae]
MFIVKFLKPVNSDFIRFLLVGVVNTLTGLLIMLILLNSLGLSYWISTFTGNTIGACVSFLLNRTFTFRSTISFQKGIPRFCAIIFICYFSSYFCSEKILQAAGQIFTADQAMLQNGSVLLGSGFYTISNYFGQKYIVFKKITTA